MRRGDGLTLVERVLTHELLREEMERVHRVIEFRVQDLILGGSEEELSQMVQRVIGLGSIGVLDTIG